MPTGIRTTLNGITVSGTTFYGEVDLETVFHARGTATAIANSGVSGASRDCSDWFYPLSKGGTKLEVDVGIKSAGNDLRNLYAKRGTVTSGGGNPGGGCLPFDTPIPLWDSGTKAMGELRPGDIVIGYYADGMLDESVMEWRDWSMPAEGAGHGVLIPVTVVTVMIGTYENHFLFNDELRATYEHPFLILRAGNWQWRRAEDIRVGDAMLTDGLRPMPITTIEHVAVEMKTANINVEEVDNYFVNAMESLVLAHNNSSTEEIKN